MSSLISKLSWQVGVNKDTVLILDVFLKKCLNTFANQATELGYAKNNRLQSKEGWYENLYGATPAKNRRYQLQC